MASGTGMVIREPASEVTIGASTWATLVSPAVETVAVGAAMVLGAAASITIEPLGAIDVYALVGGFAMLAVLLWNAARFVRPAPTASV